MNFILFIIVNEAVGNILPSMFIHFIINASSTVGLHYAMKTLQGLHEDYIEAQKAGDTQTLEQIQEYVGDIPIASENWLEEYMNMEPYTIQEIIQYDFVPAVICAILAVFVIRTLAKNHNREEHLKHIFV